MALTRKMLRAMGIEDEKIDEIITAHSETVDALKEKIDNFENKAKEVDEIQKKLDKAEEKLKEGNNAEVVSKEEFEKLKSEYDNYKNEITTKETYTKKETAYRDMLKAGNVSDKWIDKIVKLSTDDINGIEFEADGKVKNPEKYSEYIGKEYADYIATTGTKGIDVANPPATTDSTTITKENFAKMSYNQRVDLYNENPTLYSKLTE